MNTRRNIISMGVRHTKTKRERTWGTPFAVEDLPVEMLRLILSYVPARDLLLNCSRVCKQWHELIDDDVFWRRQCDAAGVVYPASVTGADDVRLLDYKRLYFFRPFCRNLVKNWNAAG